MKDPLSKRVVHKLKLTDQFRLMELVKARYETAQQNDVDFAAFASEQLGIHVTKGNVKGAREAFGFPQWGIRLRTTSADPEVADLQRRLSALEQRVQVYPDGCLRDPACGARSHATR